MPRISLEMPEHYHFATEIPVRISDINYGGHLGNDAILSIVHESRVRLLMLYGYTEFNVEGVGIIMSDSAIVYKSESFYGEILRIEIGVKDFSRYGCDLFYRISEKESGRLVAQAKTGIVFLRYDDRKLAPVPEKFRALFS